MVFTPRRRRGLLRRREAATIIRFDIGSHPIRIHLRWARQTAGLFCRRFGRVCSRLVHDHPAFAIGRREK
jgi:hypothetical protein